MDDARLCRFGPFELDLTADELRRDGAAVPLQRQPALVLVALVAQAGRLVPRAELRRAVWGDATHVDFDRGLNYCIRHLRAALGDDARHPRFIETVARRGYRFIAPIARPVPGRSLRPRRVVAGAALMAAVALTLAVERGGPHERHHEAAVAVARAVHDFIF